jgi:uncharacterized protein
VATATDPGSDGAPGASPRASGPDGWSPWFAFAALATGLVFAAVAGVVIDVPALALGAKISESHTSPGIVIADTAVQDAGFVASAMFFAQLGGRRLAAWQFGLRPVRGLGRALGLTLAAAVAFVVFSALWSLGVHAPKEKLLETLGAHQNALLLALSAVLTCVIAPVCEEFLFRGFIFRALRNWHGTLPAALITGLLFGAVHAGSAPAADLLPLAMLGFLLCLLYRYSGSLYPCIAFHSLNNSIAFASLEEWTVGDAVALLAGALALIALLAFSLKRAGVIARPPRAPEPAPTSHHAYRPPTLQEIAEGSRGPQPK